MDDNSPEIEMEKPSDLINEGAEIVMEFINDVVLDNEQKEEKLVLSEEGKLRLQQQYKDFTEKHENDSFDKTVVRKYYYFCDEMHRIYKKSTRAIIACKIITAIIFLIVSGVFLYAGYRFGDKMLWFCMWVLLIFIDVGIFIMVDYFSDSVKTKVLPYLDDIEKLSFKREVDEEDYEYDDESEEDEEDENSETENASDDKDEVKENENEDDN